MMAQQRLFLIDAHAICYRCFYAIRGLRNQKGQPTNAVYGFLQTLNKILREHNPDHVAVCFDRPGKTLREERYAEYKIQRPTMPEDLISQMPLIREVVDALGLPVLEQDGYEADDLMATAAREAVRQGWEVVIVSDDKDMLQCLNGHIKILKTKENRLLDSPEAEKTLGFPPQRIPDYVALAGDSVDNIPGVKGIGAVTARKLIQRFGDLDNLYRHLDEVEPASVRRKLEEGRDDAFMSRDLAVLVSDMKVEWDWRSLRRQPPNAERLYQLCVDLEFKRLAEEWVKALPSKGSSASTHLTRQATGEEVVRALAKAKRVYFIFEGPDAGGQEGSGHLLLRGETADIFCVDATQAEPLKAIFENEDRVKVTIQGKKQRRALREAGISLKGFLWDVELAGYLLAPSRTTDIVSLAWTYARERLSNVREAAALLRILPKTAAAVEKDMKEKEMGPLYETIEMPLIAVLEAMERYGVAVDQAYLKKLSRHCEKEMAALETEAYRIVGREWNLNSPKQLAEILFHQLKLPVIKKTKTGYSTNEEVLRRLADQHPLPAKILAYRQLAKLKSTYIDALPQLVNPKTGRIHAEFNQTGAETGRLSSANPNLQNIPIRTELGREIRRCFIPSGKDYAIVSADYSQIELRILAHLSRDEGLIEAFQKGEDIHRTTAARIFDVAEEDVSPEMRDSAKRVNFGIIYGISAFGLAKDLGVPQGQAQAFIETYFVRFPGVKRFMDETIRNCEEKGYVTTLFQRRRYIPEIQNKNPNLRQFAQRQAINAPVQGSAADLIKLAMVKLDLALNEQGLRSRMMITVHDEIVLDAVKNEEKKLVPLVRDVMAGAIDLCVPIEVKVKRGPNWNDCEEIA